MQLVKSRRNALPYWSALHDSQDRLLKMSAPGEKPRSLLGDRLSSRLALARLAVCTTYILHVAEYQRSDRQDSTVVNR